MKRVIPILIFFVFILMQTVIAITDFSYDPIQNHVLKDQDAIFSIRITNNEYTDKTYTIKSADLNWILENTITTVVPARSTTNVELRFKQFKDLKPRNYGVNIIITSETDRIEKYLPVTLLEPTQILDVKLITPEYIDPKKPTTIKLVIENRYTIELNNLEVKLANEFIQLSESINIQKEQTRTDEFGIRFDREVKSGTYPLNVLIRDSKNIYVNKDLEIKIGIHTNLKEIIQKEESLLIKKEIITKINEGNSDVEDTFMKKLSLAQRLFTRYEPEPNVIISSAEGYIAKWNIKISPGETLIITTTTNYRTPLLLAIIIIGISYLYYSWQYRSLKVTKKVMTIHATKDTIGAIKVLITLKNKGRGELHRIKVIDRIPHLEHNPTHFIGLTPSTIKRGDGITLTWDVPKMSKGEERIFSYKIDDRVFIKRKIRLPGTYVKYEEGNKIFRTRSSGSVLKRL